jgi:HAD superfamily hydrolase (TIGR01549 family)
MAEQTLLRGVIFDVDGTLVDSNDLHAAAWQEAFRRFGVNHPFELVRSQIGKGGDLLVPDLLDARSMRQFGQELKEFRKEHFRANYLDNVRPFPGIAAAMERLRERGVELFLASSADGDEVKHYISLIGIEELIAGSTSKSDVEMSKPAPDIFEAALGKIGTPPERTIVVGDTPYDILAAHRIALPIAAVRAGGFPEDDLRKAEWLFDSVPQMIERSQRIEDYFRE